MSPEMLARISVGLGFLVWVGAAVGAAVVAWWAMDRDVPTHVESSQLLTPRVPACGELLTVRNVVREELCYTTIYRYMVDSRDVRFDRPEYGMGLSVYPNGTGPLGEDKFVGRENVPCDMAPGEAKYVALPCHRCNPLHWLKPVCETPRETRFIVEEPTADTRAKRAAEEILRVFPD